VGFSDHREQERQVVVLSLPQCHGHGRRRRAGPALRHVGARLERRRDGDDLVVGHHAVHAVADGGDARDGSREAVRPVPRAGAARVRREAGPVDRRAAAAARGGQPCHRLHGHRRAVPEEVPRRHLRRPLQGHQAHLLHHDIRLRPIRALPAPRLQLHLRRLLHRRGHVAQVGVRISFLQYILSCRKL
jgi:hypothetical protein